MSTGRAVPAWFEVVYLEHATRLLRLAVLVCGDRATAEDVVHDAFVRCHTTRAAPAPGSEGAYLRRTVLNLASNLARAQRRRSDDRLPVAVPARPAEDDAAQRESAARVVGAVRALPDRQRDCVLLTYFDGLRVDEVAEVLGISAGSVKTHLHRARATLRPALEDLR